MVVKCSQDGVTGGLTKKRLTLSSNFFSFLFLPIWSLIVTSAVWL